MTRYTAIYEDGREQDVQATSWSEAISKAQARTNTPVERLFRSVKNEIRL